MNDQSGNVSHIPRDKRDEPPTSLEQVLSLIFVFLILSPIGYAAKHRTREDFLLYGSLAGAFFLVAYTVMLASDLERPLLRHWRKCIYVLPITLPAVLTGVLFYSLSVVIKDAALYVVDAASTRNGSIVLATGLVVTIAAVLFYVRLRYRVLYGLSEVAAGITVAVSRLATQEGQVPRDADFYLAMLTAGVYLIIRGMDNVNTGWTQIREVRTKTGASLLRAVFRPLAK